MILKIKSRLIDRLFICNKNTLFNTSIEKILVNKLTYKKEGMKNE